MKNLKIEAWDQLHRINKIMMPEPNRKHEKPLIGRGQVKLLKEIMNESNLSQDELAKRARLDKTTVAKTVKKLEQHGLIRREKSADDQRKYQLFATEKATEMVKRMDEHLYKASNDMFEGLKDSEVESLLKTLDKLEDNLNNQRVKRDMLRDKGHSLVRKLKEFGSIEKTKLEADLNLAKEDFDDLLLRLIERRLIKEEAGLLYLNESHAETHMRHVHDFREKRDPEHRILFKILMDNNGLTLEELSEKADKSMDEVKHILAPAMDHSDVYEKDGLLYLEENILKRKPPRRF